MLSELTITKQHECSLSLWLKSISFVHCRAETCKSGPRLSRMVWLQTLQKGLLRAYCRRAFLSSFLEACYFSCQKRCEQIRVCVCVCVCVSLPLCRWPDYLLVYAYYSSLACLAVGLAVAVAVAVAGHILPVCLPYFTHWTWWIFTSVCTTLRLQCRA